MALVLLKKKKNHGLSEPTTIFRNYCCLVPPVSISRLRLVCRQLVMDSGNEQDLDNCHAMAFPNISHLSKYIVSKRFHADFYR